MNSFIINLVKNRFFTPFLILVLMGEVPIVLATDGFGRLFTTPEERQKLQSIRNTKPIVEEQIEVLVEDELEIEEESQAKQRDISGITLNGIVYRKNGKSTAWINKNNNHDGNLASEYIQVNEGNIHGEKVQILVPDADLDFDLKVGQTYEPNDKHLIDVVKDGDSIKISRD